MFVFPETDMFVFLQITRKMHTHAHLLRVEIPQEYDILTHAYKYMR
jgi:hypothetical protein